MGNFFDITFTLGVCSKCRKHREYIAQFKSGVNSYGAGRGDIEGGTSVGSKINLIDGRYPGEARPVSTLRGDRIVSCACIHDASDTSASVSVDIVVEDFRVKSVEASSGDTSRFGNPYFPEGPNLFVPPAAMPSRLEKKSFRVGTSSKEMIEAVEAHDQHTAIYFPFSIPSIEFVKQAAILFEGLILIDYLDTNISHGNSRDKLEESAAFRSHLDAHDMAWALDRYDQTNSENVDDDCDLSNSEDTPDGFTNEFYGYVKSLMGAGVVRKYSPDVSIQQWYFAIVENLLALPGSSADEQHAADFDIADLFAEISNYQKMNEPSSIRRPQMDVLGEFSSISNLLLAKRLTSPHVAESRKMESMLFKLMNNALRYDLLDRKVRDTIAANHIVKDASFLMPKLEVRSFEDLLEFRLRVADELKAFHTGLASISSEIQGEWNLERFSYENFEKAVQGKIEDARADLCKRGENVARQLGRGVAFSSLKAAFPVTVSAHFGLPLREAVILGSGLLTIDVVKESLEFWSRRNEPSEASRISYLLEIHRRTF